jgi:Na+/proline symporter
MNKQSGVTILIVTITLIIFLLTFGNESINYNLAFTTLAILLLIVGLPLGLFGIISLFAKKFNNRGFIITTITITALLLLINIFSKPI